MNCEKIPRYKCNKADHNCLGCKTYNIYCAGVKYGRENPLKYGEYLALVRVGHTQICISAKTLEELHMSIKWQQLEKDVVAIFGANELKGELESYE